MARRINAPIKPGKSNIESSFNCSISSNIFSVSSLTPSSPPSPSDFRCGEYKDREAMVPAGDSRKVIGLLHTQMECPSCLLVENPEVWEVGGR